MKLIYVLLLLASVACGDPVDNLAGDSRSQGDVSTGDHQPSGDPGDPLAGGDSPGDSRPGDPWAGDPWAGDPTVGDPGAGDPALVTPCGIVFPPVVVLEATVLDLYTAINAAEPLAVVDVREPGETASGIIEGALLYPWGGGVGGTLQTDHADLPDDVPLYIICASGNRSRVAANWLVANGHTCVHTVLSGMGAWYTAGYPTVIP